MSPRPSYEIVTDGPTAWKVVRSDGEIMHRGGVFACLRWVKAWGEVDLGR